MQCDSISGEVKNLASFSQSIPGKYGVKSYQETKNTYDWIMKSLYKGGFQDLEVDTDFLFDMAEITCSCKGLEEFVEHAYGQDNYSLISMDFKIQSKGISRWYISMDGSSKINIRTNTKILLEKVIDLLKDTSLDETEVNDPISVTYIEHQSNDITIDGDNNAVAVNSSTAVNIESSTNAEPRWKQNLKAIVQNLIANWIWYLLTATIAAIITFFATHN